ncbi:MAG: ABC transporter ATP-binding protein [Deltaproteobacteria bacterium]|nr:ABC transporter ATP-binding protein [Deltaproteobacteria bacterium]
MSDDVILEAKGLARSFGGIKAVDGVSFELKANQVLGIIGPNGSGKTTLVNLLTGFVKPDQGQILYKGQDVTGLPPYKLAGLGVARSFQMVKPFYELPAFKNLIIPLFSSRVRRLAGGKSGDRDAVAKDLLEEVGFERDSQVITQRAGSLPHGYLKRMELAKCMALRPDLYVLDELFSGLSLAEVASLVPVIDKLMAQGATIIMVEHRLRELFRIANQVIVLNFGRKIAHGAPQEVMNNPEVKSAYLGSETED